MKTAAKILLVILLIVALITGSVLFLLVGTYARVYKDLDQYEQDLAQIANAAQFMPELSTLGGYTDIKYTYTVKCYSTIAGFYSDAFALFVTYDQTQYDKEKEEILSKYTFLEAPVMRSSDTYTLPITEFKYKGYSFKVVPDEEYIDYSACKSFMLVGFNDELKRIVYMYYYDFDIDYIASVGDDLDGKMCDLVDTAFTWVN